MECLLTQIFEKFLYEKANRLINIFQCVQFLNIYFELLLSIFLIRWIYYHNRFLYVTFFYIVFFNVTGNRLQSDYEMDSCIYFIWRLNSSLNFLPHYKMSFCSFRRMLYLKNMQSIHVICLQKALESKVILLKYPYK